MQHPPSPYDVENLRLVRRNVDVTQTRAGASLKATDRVMEIGPAADGGLKRFSLPCPVETLDKEPGCTHQHDICHPALIQPLLLARGTFDVIVACEVLEHTSDPFTAVKFMHTMLKPGGRLFLTTPFDLRIHGPRPDLWRFTEDGLRRLLSEFHASSVRAIENFDRPLMPICYTVEAVK